MEMRLELQVAAADRTIALHEHILLVGSCFTSNIGEQMSALGLNCTINPGGILFNPFSIKVLFERALSERLISEDELFEHHELHNHWQFHGSFSATHKEEALQRMNAALLQTATSLKTSHHIIITLGSAFTYSVKEGWPGAAVGSVVANCHKVPANSFHHRLPAYSEVVSAVAATIALIRSVNANAQVIFTVSPVRHYREGLVENNRSKGLLLNAVAQNLAEQVMYFAAYELVMDDLRDYRFYADDLVHPNYAATAYVWNKFRRAFFSESSRQVLEQVEEINRAVKHRALHPNTLQHRSFLQKYYNLVIELMKRHPYLNLQKQADYFLGEAGR